MMLCTGKQTDRVKKVRQGISTSLPNRVYYEAAETKDVKPKSRYIKLKQTL